MTSAISDLHQIEIQGVTYAWDRASDLMLMNGMPVAAFLLESTLAGMMWGVERMVGHERFELAMQAAGRRSVDDEWRTFISQMPAPEIGIELLGNLTALGGLGRWKVIDFDHAGKTAVFRVTAGFEPIYQRALGVAWGSSFLAGKFAGYCTHAFATYCWAEQTRFVVKDDEFDEFVVRPSDRSIEDRLDALLFTATASPADVAAALERVRREVDERREVEVRLRAEVEERRRVEDDLRGKLELIERQAEDIQAMSTPILQIWSGVLAVPVVGRLDSERASRLMEALLGAIVERRARAAIIDLTGAEGLDPTTLDHLLQLAGAIRLLGARCLVSGMSPMAAQIAAVLGVDLHALAAHATLEDALQAALRADGVQRPGKRPR
ncbi:MAG: STAS domain-containing protein [Nannocystis sp.]|nr:STAS domain-containing protein [Nannocystis sp.]MBA3548182.1 STAS domain-containing protein [Nannocystis sp.]